MESPVYYHIIVYSKSAPLHWVGHLDWLRYWERLIRRQQWPVKYSEGFQKIMKLDFIQPLGTGVEGHCEMLMIPTTQPLPVQENLERLQKEHIPGLKILKLVQSRVPAKWFHKHKSSIRYRLTTHAPVTSLTVLDNTPELLGYKQLDPSNIDIWLPNTAMKQINIREFLKTMPQLSVKEFKRMQFYYKI